MRGWLLDTNVVSELGRPRAEPRVLDWLAGQRQDRAYISILTLGELDQGIEALALNDPRREPLRRFQRHIEKTFSGRILTVDDKAVRRWGALSGSYRRILGGKASVVDALIAAQAEGEALYVASRNVRDFAALGCAVFNPWTDDPADFPVAR